MYSALFLNCVVRHSVVNIAIDIQLELCLLGFYSFMSQAPLGGSILAILLLLLLLIHVVDSISFVIGHYSES